MKPVIHKPDFYGRDRHLSETDADCQNGLRIEVRLINTFLRTTRAKILWMDKAGELHELREAGEVSEAPSPELSQASPEGPPEASGR